MIILNKDKEIREKLINKINASKEVYIAISFITEKGLKEIMDKLLLKKVKVITTTEEFITDPNSLKILLKNNIEVKLINNDNLNRSFHSKFIVFKNNFNIDGMVGSFNLTNNSFFHKYESVSFTKGDQLLRDFNYLWQKGKLLTSKIISEYEKKYIFFYKDYYNFKKNLLDKINFKPNEMQKKVLKELEEVRLSSNRALLWAATGTGKTYLAALDSKKIGFKKLLFIVHNRTIIKTAKRDFENIHYDKKCLELFVWNNKRINNHDIIFTTEKTILSLIKENKNFLDKFNYFVFDEAHKLGERNKQGDIFNLLKNRINIFILAMTATPNRTDKPGYLIEQMKHIVGRIDTLEAINLNLICKFKYYGIDVEVDFDQENLKNNNLNLMVDKFIEQLKKQNFKIWDNKKIKGLIFVKNINEANDVSLLLNEKGYESEVIHSKSNFDSDQIGEFIEDLQDDSKSLNFLVTINKFNEGVDIPKINTIGMFRFTESSIIYTQQIGRGLRKDDSDKKYLNVIDLVGNHENNYERIGGLIGKNIISPKESLERIYNIKNMKDNIFIDFNMTKIAQDKILKSLRSISYKKYFKDKFFDLSKKYQKKLFLSNFEEELDEEIQIISNNIRKKRTLNFGDKAWLVLAHQYMGEDVSMISKKENQIIELFSWMPLTVSSPKEKNELIKLINGEEAKLSFKWASYFLGKNIFARTNSQIVKGDFSNEFEYKNNILKFKNNIYSEKFKFFLDEIKEYLILNKKRNDKLSSNRWYSKVEIGFMAGYTSNVMQGKFGRYKEEKDININDLFLTNTIAKKKGALLYKNKVYKKNKFIISNDENNNFKYPMQVHNFLGRDLFYNSVLYKYIGQPSTIEEYDIEIGRQNSISNKEYKRFMITTKNELNNRDYFYFKFNL